MRKLLWSSSDAGMNLASLTFYEDMVLNEKENGYPIKVKSMIKAQHGG